MPESQPIPMKDLGDYIDYDEAEKVLASAENARDKILLGLLWCCGLRASELGTIQWKNIDLEDNAIIVIGKCKKAGRVPVEPRLMEWIKEYNMLYYNPEGYLLEGNGGKGIGRSMIWRLVDKYSKRTDGASLAVAFSFHGITSFVSGVLHKTLLYIMTWVERSAQIFPYVMSNGLWA